MGSCNRSRLHDELRGGRTYTAVPTEQPRTQTAVLKALKSLNAHLRRVRSQENLKKLSLLHDDTGPCTSVDTTQAIKNSGCRVLPYPPYSTDLARTDYRLFGPFKRKGNARTT